MARFHCSIDDPTELESVASKTNRSTKSEVVRDALTLYRYLLFEHERGNKIFVGASFDDTYELKVSSFPTTE